MGKNEHEHHLKREGQASQPESHQSSPGEGRQEVTIIFWYHTPFQRDLIYSVCSRTVLREVLIKGKKNFDTREAEINI